MYAPYVCMYVCMHARKQPAARHRLRVCTPVHALLLPQPSHPVPSHSIPSHLHSYVSIFPSAPSPRRRPSPAARLPACAPTPALLCSALLCYALFCSACMRACVLALRRTHRTAPHRTAPRCHGFSRPSHPPSPRLPHHRARKWPWVSAAVVYVGSLRRESRRKNDAAWRQECGARPGVLHSAARRSHAVW